VVRTDESHSPGAAGSTALVVVDMQEYFCTAESVWGRVASAMFPKELPRYLDRLSTTVVPNIQALLGEFRRNNSTVVFVEFGCDKADGSDFPGWARSFNRLCLDQLGELGFLPLAAPECRVIKDLAPLPNELVVQKPTSGPLAGTKLDYTLNRHGITKVVVTGIMTNVCVTGAVRELADANFETFVVPDATATPFGEDVHQHALDTLRFFGSVESTSYFLA
jgi:nicotinamidase-related amidase